MHRRAFVTALGSAVLAAAPVAAHDGHDHKLLGTVTEVRADRLVVKAARDGVLSAIAITAATKVTRGKARFSAADLKAGDRVVVNVGNGKPPLVARTIQVGPAPTTR